MTNIIKEATERIPFACRVSRCKRDGCGVYLEGMPSHHLVVDLDCKELGIENHKKRCDYLFICDGDGKTWVAPIELKGGKVGSADDVTEQLQGGADLAAQHLPADIVVQLTPVLVHQKSIHPDTFKKLRRKRVKLHKARKPIKIIKCGKKLVDAFP